MKPIKYKTIQHYHEPGDLHEFTFSCYRKLNLLTNDAWRGYLARSLDAAGKQFRIPLVAFVFMPDHVHLLTFPLEEEPDLEGYLAAIKRPTSDAIKQELVRINSRLLSRLTVRERADKACFRFWQKGPGYDRNLNQPTTVVSSIDYLHLNPVRRGLVTEARRWKWSSACFYDSDGQELEPDLPHITPLPAEYWN